MAPTSTPPASDTDAAFQRAYAAAARLGRDEIGTGALLLGLVTDPDPRALVPALLRRLGCDVDALRADLEGALRQTGAGPVPPGLPLNDSAEAALAEATREARRRRRAHVEPVHLLLGLLRRENDAARRLQRHDVTYTSATAALDGAIRDWSSRIEPIVPPRARPAPRRRGGVFISYRRGDADRAAAVLYDELSRAFGEAAVFKDVRSIPIGTDFRTHLGAAIRGCRVFLALINPAWEARIRDRDDFVRLEVEAALDHGVPVVPLLLDGARMPPSAMLPDAVRPVAFQHGMPLRHAADYRADARALVAAIQRDL